METLGKSSAIAGIVVAWIPMDGKSAKTKRMYAICIVLSKLETTGNIVKFINFDELPMLYYVENGT